jgi:Na+-transporting methylmalonyl-CoA/oxaloacetate decarboxylase gamma subunit
MISLSLLAGAVQDSPGFGDDLTYAILGMVVVMLALAGLTALMYANGWLFRRVGTEAQNRTVRPAAQAIPEPPTGIEPQVVAAIAAAVQATVIAPHHIVTITALPVAGSWTTEGRRQLVTSHKLR